MNDESGGMWSEAVVAYFKVPFRYLLDEGKEMVVFPLCLTTTL
jgi:hypothetical protein